MAKATRKHLLDRIEPDPIALHQAKALAAARERERIEALSEASFRGFLESVIKANVSPLPPQPKQPKRSRSRDAHARFPKLDLNDWHFEEIVKPDGVLGLNAYDIPTACRRVYRIIQAAKEWKADMEAGGRYVMPELHIDLKGDMLTGTLHGLERHSSAPNIVRAALACGQLIALAVDDVARDYDRVTVTAIPGNHGRLPDDRKVPTKDPTRSWDYVAYYTARCLLRHNPRISWCLPDAYGVLYQVGGHWCYSAHGNFIPNNLGVVGYGVRRFVASLASNLQAAGKPLRYAFFGHWHSAHGSEFAGVEAFISPALIGTQEYGFLSGGSVNRPAQSLFVFSREHGLVSQERLYGEGTGYKGTYEVTV